MSWLAFHIKKFPKSFLGIDIGTSSIRVVELSRKAKNLILTNYGEVKTSSLQKSPFRVFEKNSLVLSNREIAVAIESILKTAEIQTKEVNFSIPDFATFFTTFQLPPMEEKELSHAIKYEARSYIPLPLSEITLDWLIIEGRAQEKFTGPIKILVAAIPNEIIEHYQEIANLTNLKMRSLEAEAFSLARALSYNQNKIISIVDIGARSTTINVLENGVLKSSHSFNLSGNEITATLSRSLKIDYKKAEELKIKVGLAGLNEKINVREILIPVIDLVLNEIKKIFQNFYQQEGKNVEKIILSGGTALLPGLKEYVAQEFKQEVEIANPFFGISYPPILEEVLKEMGPIYSIAVGLAKKEFF